MQLTQDNPRSFALLPLMGGVGYAQRYPVLVCEEGRFSTVNTSSSVLGKARLADWLSLRFTSSKGPQGGPSTADCTKAKYTPNYGKHIG